MALNMKKKPSIRKKQLLTMEKMEKNNFSEQTKIIQIDGKSFMYTCLSKGFANIETIHFF